MSATLYPPRPQRDKPGEPAACRTGGELERVRAENEQLRELVVQLSRLVAHSAMARK